MGPETIYFLLAVAIVLPLLPFSRAAWVVAYAWLPGQILCWIGAGAADVAAVDMIMSITAIGVGLAVVETDAERVIVLTYIATAFIHFQCASGLMAPHDAWWLDWYWAMARLAMLPFTVNWTAVRKTFSVRLPREWGA